MTRRTPPSGHRGPAARTDDVTNPPDSGVPAQAGASVPLDLDQPYWCDDPDFDINAHIYDVGIAAPGSRDQLKGAGLTDRGQTARPQPAALGDRGRQRTEDGQTAVISTVHHSLIDGGSSNDINSVLLDRDPDADQTNPPPQPYNPEPTPDPLERPAMTANAVAAAQSGEGSVGCVLSWCSRRISPNWRRR